MATSNRVIKNTLFLYIRMGITILFALFTTRVTLNVLGETDFGIFNIVGGVIGMLGFLNAAMASASQRFLNISSTSKDIEWQKIVFNASVRLHRIIAIVALFLFILMGFFLFTFVLNIPDNRVDAALIVYVSLIISTVLTILTVPYDALLNAHENMFYYAIIGILESFLKMMVALIIMGNWKDRLAVYGIFMSIIPMVSIIIMRYYCRRHYTECVISKEYYNRQLSIAMAKFAGWNCIGVASNMIGNYGLGIVLNHFFGALLNAAQGITRQLSGQLYAFSQNMLKAVSPVITKYEGRGEREKMLSASFTASKFSYYIFAFFSIPLIIEMPVVLEWWLIKVPAWTVVFCRLQIIRMLIEHVTAAFSSSIAAQGDISGLNKVTTLLNIMPLGVISILFCYGFMPYAMYVTNIVIFGIALDVVKIYYMHVNLKMEYMDFLKRILVPITIVTANMLLIESLPFIISSSKVIRAVLVFFFAFLLFVPNIWFVGTTKTEKAALKMFYNTVKERISIR